MKKKYIGERNMEREIIKRGHTKKKKQYKILKKGINIKRRLYKKKILQKRNYMEKKHKQKRNIKIKKLYIEINYMARK